MSDIMDKMEKWFYALVTGVGVGGFFAVIAWGWQPSPKVIAGVAFLALIAGASSKAIILFNGLRDFHPVPIVKG